MRWSLFDEIVRMSWETLRVNKMRSVLTVLGVVIGITSIVGMTSLIRGFDQSLRDSIKTIGSHTVFVAKISGVSMAAGGKFEELIKRPNLTPEDAAAIERGAPSIETVSIILGQGGGKGSVQAIDFDQEEGLAAFGTQGGAVGLLRLPGGEVVATR